MSEWQSLLQTLKQPEYVHVLLNPLPVYGMICGILALVVALPFRSRPAQIVGLVLVLVACISVWPVVEYGEAGHDRVQSLSLSEGEQWLHVHEERAEVGEWVYGVTAVVALAAIVLPIIIARTQLPLLLATLLLALVATGIGGWIGHAGGQIRHTEFRNGPPPAEPAEHGD